MKKRFLMNTSYFGLFPLLMLFVVSCANAEKQTTAEWQTIDRYQVKDDLVKDTKTGLMWMRCSLGQKWDGSTCQGKAEKYNFGESLQVTDYFSRHAHAGYSDWRLPKREELKTLVYCSNGQGGADTDITGRVCNDNSAKPAIEKTAFPETVSSGFWSSSPCDANHACVWGVNFGSGGYSPGDLEYDNFAIRLVRGTE
jgi:hypothetical protein